MKVSKFLRRVGFIPALLILLVGAANIAHAQNLVLADKKASKQTQLLYANLLKLTNRGVMFGHQDDLAYGVGWQYIPGRSDVKSVTGSYPAVFGWELGGLEQGKDNNLDGVPFNNIINYAGDVYKWGGINTFSWHFNDPVTKATAWSTPQSSVKKINEGGKNFAAYKNYLNKFAKFARKLKGPDGELTPIIFRPLHENKVNWFWWGSSSCTPAEYVQLWRFTFDYLVKEKKIHNLIFAYSTAFCPTVNVFEERYPGDDYVDIVGFDAYCDDDTAFFVKDLANRFNVLDTIAAKHQKIAALTEVGMNKNIQKNWWTQVLLPELKKHKVAYALSWRNWKKEHYYAPYPGQASAEDFIEFYNDPATLFLNDMDTNVYQ